MKRFALLLLPAALWSGQARYARMGEVEGTAQVQMQAADKWEPGVRNMVLTEGAWVRSDTGARVEIELDEGSALRMAGEAQCEISDYSRLSTGQRITLLSLDHGLAYFTGAAAGYDSLVIALPGAQVTVRRGTRLRLEAREDSSVISVIEGVARFSSPAAELDLSEGQTTRVDPGNAAKFYLYREVTAMDTDRWSEQRDKALAAPAAAGHLPNLHFGLADLDANGNWIETEKLGTVWRPKTADGWAPFRNGKWRWYEGLGYTWISSDAWGWLPSHYGRWVLDESSGWVWAPGKAAVFKPGDVYWMRGTNLAGWGPLTAGEEWTGKGVPVQYLAATTTWAKFAPEALEIEPGETVRPKDPLLMARFTAALPSPSFVAARLDAARPVLRAGSTRVTPRLAGVTFESDTAAAVRAASPGAAPEAQTAPQTAQQTVVIPPAPQPTVIVEQPPAPAPPQEVYYPAPVYTGIVVVNPPEREHRKKPQPAPQPAPSGGTQPEPKPAPHEQPKPVQRSAETPPRHSEPKPQPPAGAPAVQTPSQPLQRSAEPTRHAAPPPAPKAEPPAADDKNPPAVQRDSNSGNNARGRK